MQKSQQRLVVTGISHQSAGVEIRELLRLERKELPACLQYIKAEKGVEAILILSTCNRLEFYFLINVEINLFNIINLLYLSKKDFNTEHFNRYFYQFEGVDAVRHLFRVISGIESLVFGEYQIQGQVKEAYSIACEAKTLDKTLHKLFHAAFRLGKKVRNETSIGDGRQSVGGAASQIIIDNLRPQDIISIIGINENTKIFASELKKAGFDKFIFLNRTLYKAEMMASEFGGKAIAYERRIEALSESVGVFSCTGAPGYIVSCEALKNLSMNKQLPKVIIDMAVPRDIDTQSILGEALVYDIDNLKDYLDKNINYRKRNLPQIEKIIEVEAGIFEAWNSQQDNEFIQPYAEKFEILRRQVLEEFREQFSEQAYQKVDKLTHNLVHQLQSEFIRAFVKSQGQ